MAAIAGSGLATSKSIPWANAKLKENWQKPIQLSIFISILILISLVCGYGQTNYTWTNGSGDNLWNNPNNWNCSGCGSSPGDGTYSNENVTFDNVTANCTLDLSPSVSVNSLNITSNYTGAISLGNNSIIINGGAGYNNIFANGTLSTTGGSMTIASASGVTFSGTNPGNVNISVTLSTSTGIFTSSAGKTFGGTVTVSAYSFFLSNTTFNGASSFTKTGTGVDVSNGGNVFNNSASLSVTTSSGSNGFQFGNSSGDTFKGALNLSITGSSSNSINLQTGAFTTSISGDITCGGLNNASARFSMGCQTNGTSPVGTIILNGSANQTITFNNAGIGGGLKFGNVKINTSAGAGIKLKSATANNYFSIYGTMTFLNGIVSATSTFPGYVNFASGSSSSGASNNSFINDKVVKTGATAFTFPIGPSNYNYYRPITITPVSNTNATDQISAKYYAADPGNHTPSSTYYETGVATVSTAEYWDVTRVTGTSNTYKVTLSWDTSPPYMPTSADPNYIHDFTSLIPVYYVAASSQWQKSPLGVVSPNTGNNSAGTTSSNTAVSPTLGTAFKFTLGSTDGVNPLPITLVDFNSHRSGNSVVLKWETASEIDNAFFTLYRSLNGTEFEKISQVNGAGTSNAEHQYQYVYTDAPLQLTYYRLSQTDFDGKTTTLRTTSVPTTDGIFVWPIPATDIINISIGDQPISKVSLTDIFGRIVVDDSIHSSQCQVKTDGLTPGFYVLRIFAEGEIFTTHVQIK